jgi:hypothetical protein
LCSLNPNQYATIVLCIQPSTSLTLKLFWAMKCIIVSSARVESICQGWKKKHHGLSPLACKDDIIWLLELLLKCLYLDETVTFIPW